MQLVEGIWLRGVDLNLRPLGYEPNELPDCSTPQNYPSATSPSRQTPTQFSSQWGFGHAIEDEIRPARRRPRQTILPAPIIRKIVELRHKHPALYGKWKVTWAYSHFPAINAKSYSILAGLRPSTSAKIGVFHKK